MSFSNPLNAGQTLILGSFRSPNYVAHVSGWTINKDGTAEFSNVTVRGELDVIGPSGAAIKVEPGNVNPFIDFVSPDGTNDAFINITAGAGANNADLGLNSGQWTPADGVLRRGRIFMAGQAQNLLDWSVIRQATQQSFGGRVQLTPTSAKFGYADQAGAIFTDITATADGILTGNRHIQDANPQTWLFQGATSTTGAFSAEQIMGTLPNFNFLAHRCYRVTYSFQFNVATSGATMNVRIRDTNIAGTIRGMMSFPGTQVGNIPHSAKGEFYLRNTTGATINRGMCVTASSTGGNIAVQTDSGLGTTYSPWYIRIDEDRSDTDIPWAVTL